MEINKRPEPPSGVRRLLWRLPIQLYRMRIGWLLGGRMMLITHTGRVSGVKRQAVIEVVEQDPSDGSYVAASGFGVGADWYQNVTTTPDVTIQVGSRTVPATATPVSADDGPDLMARYAARHPRAAKGLCRIMGFAVDGSASDYRAVGSHLPFVRFTPRPATSPGHAPGSGSS